MFKYKYYLENNQGNIKHIILNKKREFHLKFTHFWETWLSSFIALPYVIIGILLVLIYHHSNNIIIEVICFILLFLLIPFAIWVLSGIRETIENYIFDEFIFPQIEQKYIKKEHEDFES